MRFDRLDSNGIAEILKSADMRKLVNAAANDIAGNVQTPEPAEVVVDDYTTDRAASSVTVKHAVAAGWQARDGLLTRAAAAIGAEVTSR